MKILAVIPARYQSSRFEGKPLVDICGKLMIERVYLQAKKVNEFTDIYVATDDDRIFSACQERNIKCIMTSSKHKTGTDRTGEVANKIPADLYINIQGDEPLIEPTTIRQAILPFLKTDSNDIQVTNLMTQIKDPAELLNFTIPKVIVAQDGRGVFLTRSAAPFPKGSIDVKYYKQVCVYGFTPEALRFFCTSPRGQVESIEDIEILRFIEAGRKVQYIKVDSNTVAVDTPNDLEKVRKIIEQQFAPPLYVL
jgi:3-deoxy-manno-octulosonate cytidylyltransferase (CMP-KDO synthetase)